MFYIFCICNLFSIKIVAQLHDRFDSTVISNKIIPKQHEQVIITVLQQYPELANTNIEFKIKRRITPLSAKPKLLSLLRNKTKRKYVILISNATIKKLDGILLSSLSHASQLGVIGHELAHISEFESYKKINFIHLFFKQFSKKALDQFEFNTDRRCIDHGLGYELLSWSKEVREKLAIAGWRVPISSKRERYMNPSTIEKYMGLN